jgi:hypothetical protein
MAVTMGGHLQDSKSVSMKVGSQFIIVGKMDVLPPQ